MNEDDLPDIKLPTDWPEHVVRAILHLIALAHYVFMRALGLLAAVTLRWLAPRLSVGEASDCGSSRR